MNALPIPVPNGGFGTNEDEARWLEQTILLRLRETMSECGVNARVTPIGLYEMLLLGLDNAARRARRAK